MVNVIIPVHNAESYLCECLDSVLAQDVDDMRVFCVDDGSTDNSLSVLKRYSNQDSRITVIHTKNYGPSHARNVALRLLNYSDGSLLTFIDSDDAWAPGYLANMVKEMKNCNADVVCSSFTFLKDGQYKKSRYLSNEKRLLFSFEATKELLADRTIQSHSHGKIYKTYLWDGVRFPEGIVSMEDQATTFRTFAKAKKILVIGGEAGYYYRQTQSSICSSDMSNKKIIDSLRGYYLPCCFAFSPCFGMASVEISRVAQGAFGLCALMMLPRFNRRTATAFEMGCYHQLLDIIKREKIVWKIYPKSKTERVKKLLFLICRPLYYWLYRRFART